MKSLQPCMAHCGVSEKAVFPITTTATGTTTKTKTSDKDQVTALDRKRQEIVAGLMAVFDRELDTWLDYSFAEPMRRVRKRARAALTDSSDSENEHGRGHDSGVEDCVDGGGGGGTTAIASISTTAATNSSSGSGSGGSGGLTLGAKSRSSTKKRAKREVSSSSAVLAPTPISSTGGDGGGGGEQGTASLFACPFYAHNPGKYKSVKTCLGPGWNNTHRVKEHIYRRHCQRHTCPRCCEPFKSDEDLKNHQRQDEPCKKNNRADNNGNNSNNDNVITDEQEKLIRQRARMNQPEEERWRELYRILFPGEEKTIPSPYYGSPAGTPTIKCENERRNPTVISVPPSSPTPASSHRSPSSPSGPGGPGGPGGPNIRKSTTTKTKKPLPAHVESIQFRDEAELTECRSTLRRNLSRLVMPYIQQEVDKMFQSVQHVMTVKVTELCKEVGTKLVRTWQFGNDQSQNQSQYQTQTQMRTQAHTHTHAHAHSYPQAQAGAPPVVQAGGYYHQEQQQHQQQPAMPNLGPGPIEMDYDQFLTNESAPFTFLDTFFTDGLFDLESFLRETEGDGVAGAGYDLGCAAAAGGGETFSTTISAGTSSTNSISISAAAPSDSAYFSTCTMSESVDGSMSASGSAISLDGSSYY